MPVFVPDPEDFQLEDFIEQLAFDLAERYRDAEDELIRELAARIYRDLELQQLDPGVIVPGGLTAVQRREQNRILALLADHRARSIRELQVLAMQVVDRLSPREFAEALVRTAAEEGEAAAAARLGFARRLPVEQIPLSFIGGGVTGIAATTLNASATQAVTALVLSLQSRLEVLNQRITRYPQDAYQQIVSLVAPRTLLGVTTSLQQQQQTVQAFLSRGITGFQDRSGRQWRLGSYAEMAGRTAVNRAFNDAAVWRMQQSGINLVVIVGGFDACKRCAPWIGKVLSSDGSAPGPRIVQHATEDRSVGVSVAGTLDGARAAGWNHPNCRCRPVAYLPGLSIPQGNFEYNAQAEKDRIRQRALERELRAAKRDLAIAPNDIARREAERDIAALEAEIRDHLAVTRQNRQRHREQPGFASTIGT